jgi:hypothetical protein
MTTTTMNPLAPTSAVTLDPKTSAGITARWAEWEPGLTAALMMSRLSPTLQPVAIDAYRDTHRRRCLACIDAGIGLSRIRRTDMDNPRLTDAQFHATLSAYVQRRTVRKRVKHAAD